MWKIIVVLLIVAAAAFYFFGGHHSMANDKEDCAKSTAGIYARLGEPSPMDQCMKRKGWKVIGDGEYGP